MPDILSSYHRAVVLRWTLLLVLIAGCDRYDPDGEFVGEPCEQQAVRSFGPAADSVEGYVDGPAWVNLRCASETIGLGTTRSDGRRAEGVVSTHHGGRHARWRPTERLQPQTQYSVHFESPEGAHDWSFTTNAVGAPTDNRLSGLALAMHAADGALLDPPGLDDVLGPALAALHPVVQFRGDPGGPAGTVPTVLGARTSDDNDSPQDRAVRTRLPNARWADPLFEMGPMRLEWPLAGVPFILENARVAGGISPDAAWGAGFSLEGWWDTRAADPVWGDGLGSLCEAAANAGGECTECTDGARSCLRFELVLARATSWDGDLEDVD